MYEQVRLLLVTCSVLYMNRWMYCSIHEQIDVLINDTLSLRYKTMRMSAPFLMRESSGYRAALQAFREKVVDYET